MIEFVIEENGIGNCPLPIEVIKEYDLEECKKEIKRKITKYIKLRNEYSNFPVPSITKDYVVRYEQHVHNSCTSSVERCVIGIVEMEEMCKQVVDAIRALNRDEYQYFLESFFWNRSDNYIIDFLGITKYLLQPIKNSCILKVAMAFNVAKKSK